MHVGNEEVEGGGGRGGHNGLLIKTQGAKL